MSFWQDPRNQQRIMRFQALALRLLQQLGRGLWFATKQLARALAWLWKKLWIIIRYLMRLADRLITWVIPKAKLTFANAVDWYENSEGYSFISFRAFGVRQGGFNPH